jgi:hypothetical protein
MSRGLVVRPGAQRQFASPRGTFCLVTTAELADDVLIDDGHAYSKTMVMVLRPGDDLGAMLRSSVPAPADVLIACPGLFVTSPSPEDIGGERRIAIMPCGSTPTTRENVRYFLDVIERTDPAAQEDRADRFFEAVSQSQDLRIVDVERETTCTFDPGDEDYSWNQQAGPLGWGEQQIAPAGELSVLPTEITSFDPTRVLALSGSLTLRGWPIVHAGYEPELAPEQAELYDALLPLYRNPVIVDIADGVIVACRPASDTAAKAASALESLLNEDARYRTIWELGFGINDAMSVVPSNCGLNEPYGGTNGVVHIGLGLTPFTRFALTFLCPDSTLTDHTGTSLIGRPLGSSPTRRRVKRTHSASCGCH